MTPTPLPFAFAFNKLKETNGKDGYLGARDVRASVFGPLLRSSATATTEPRPPPFHLKILGRIDGGRSKLSGMGDWTEGPRPPASGVYLSTARHSR